MSRDVGRRSKSRERERDRMERDRRRRRSRSRERHSDRRDRRDRGGGDRAGRPRSFSRSRSRSPQRDSKKSKLPQPDRKITEADLEGKTESEQDMLKLMGFCSFDTSKGKKVEGNDVGAVHVILKRKYRQYMNRKGGFNRPLDFVA